MATKSFCAKSEPTFDHGIGSLFAFVSVDSQSLGGSTATDSKKERYLIVLASSGNSLWMPLRMGLLYLTCPELLLSRLLLGAGLS